MSKNQPEIWNNMLRFLFVWTFGFPGHKSKLRFNLLCIQAQLFKHLKSKSKNVCLFMCLQVPNSNFSQRSSFVRDESDLDRGSFTRACPGSERCCVLCQLPVLRVGQSVSRRLVRAQERRCQGTVSSNLASSSFTQNRTRMKLFCLYLCSVPSTKLISPLGNKQS